MAQTKVIGITGIFGAGKTTVLSLLRERRFPVVSADEIVHELLKKKAVSALVSTRFGKSVRNARGGIDRKVLGAIVFRNGRKRKELENLLHPLVFEQVRKEILDCCRKRCTIVFVEIPLLFETKSERLFDKIIVVSSSHRIIRQRLKKSFAEEEIRKRWKSQLPQAEKKARADFLVDNSGSYSHTREQIEAVLARIR